MWRHKQAKTNAEEFSDSGNPEGFSIRSTYRIVGIFQGGKMFVSSEFLASSWKNFHGCGTLNHTPVLCGTVLWVKIFVVRLSTTKLLPPEKYPLYSTCTCTCMPTHCSNTYSGTCTLQQYIQWYMHTAAIHTVVHAHCSNTYSGTCTLQQYIQWYMHTAAIHTVVHAHCSNTYSGTCTLQQYATNTYMCTSQ